MRFYTGKMFPAEYQNNIFIAMRGSWNRTVKQGYNVMRVKLDENGKVRKHEPFLDRLPARREGRPADVGPAGRRAGDEATARCWCRTTTTASFIAVSYVK
mgnify:CR=1 FL=1